ncbi:MAG: pantetheine-phosphate adenylyltransferase [Bacteroidaceae bacterium]|jgi:pantetheine-phosphate adenylyltransferase|nr:pantetheine-phosphate adenylyltransferase [Bacteroidaceae bacterium]
MERIALFPGSFDPFTVGHASVIRRALPLFDKIIIAVGINEAKKTLFTIDRRMGEIRRIYKDEPRIEVQSYDTLTIDFAKKVRANFILRGLRSVRDFEYERDIAEMNSHISGIETVLLFTEHQYAYVSSSAIRELISYGKDVQEYLP